MSNKSILFNQGIAVVILSMAIFILAILNASIVYAKNIKPNIETLPNYHESAIRRFEIVSLISVPFTAIHSYLIFRCVKMIQQGKFSPDISDNDYRIIGGMTLTFSAFIGFWDWYHTHDKDTSQPKIPNQKIWEQQKQQTQNLSLKRDFTSDTKSTLSDDNIIVVQLYQIKF